MIKIKTMETRQEESTTEKPIKINTLIDNSICEHYYVPVGDYEQNGKFICTECKHEI